MIGIDIVEVKRFVQISGGDYASWGKVFTRAEWEYCFNKPQPAQHLAGTFAAKEAVMKALGGAHIGRFDKIEISHDKNGVPHAVVIERGERAISVSISHDGGYAAAVALL